MIQRIRLKLWQLTYQRLLKKGERFEIVKVLAHRKEHIGRSYYHSATVEVLGGVTDKSLFCHVLSAKVGYDPTGYGRYGEVSVIECSDGLYRATWQTGDSCD